MALVMPFAIFFLFSIAFKADAEVNHFLAIRNTDSSALHHHPDIAQSTFPERYSILCNYILMKTLDVCSLYVQFGN